MYVTPEGKEIFVVDGHIHYWDGSPENQRNIHGKQFIECFYAYHNALSPVEQRWEKSHFEKYSPDDLYRDLFVDGPDDMAIIQTTVLGDFYKKGFGCIERSHEMAKRGSGLLREIDDATVDVESVRRRCERFHRFSKQQANRRYTTMISRKDFFH